MAETLGLEQSGNVLKKDPGDYSPARAPPSPPLHLKTDSAHSE